MVSASGQRPAAASRRILRNAGFRAAGEVVAKVASLALYVVMARKLGEGGFGTFTFAVSLTTVLLLASGFGTEELVTREVARDQKQVHRLLGDVMVLKAVTSVLLLGVAALVVNIAGYPAEVKLVVYIVGFAIAAENLGRSWHSVFTAFERLELISISLVLQRMLVAAVGVGVLLAGGGLVAVSIVVAIGGVAGAVIAWLVLERFVVKPRWEVDRSRWIPLMRAGLPIGLATVLFTVLLRFDATLLGLLTGGSDNAEVGVYGAAFRLVEATLFLSWALTASALPWLARTVGDPRAVASGYELGAKAITSVLMPIGLAMVLFADPLIHVLYGENFEEAVVPLRLLGTMTVLYGVNALSSTVLVSQDRPNRFVAVVALVIVQNVAFNIILIPDHGADAAAFNAALSAMLLAVLGARAVAHEVGSLHMARAFGSPLAGGCAMAAVVVLSGLPALPAATLGAMAYAAALLAFERVAFPDDFRALRQLLPAWARP